MRAHTCRARNVLVVLVVPLVTIVLAACATTMPSPESSAIERPSRDTHNMVTSEELASTRAQTTVEALARLRPEFLRGSARTPLIGTPQIAVYLNNSYAGDLSTLATIPLTVVREITFLHPTEAHMRFGSACMCASGAIVLTIRRLD
jgi:hypothetical protein